METQLHTLKRIINIRLVIEVICYAYILLFLYAALYKLFDYGYFVRQLNESPLLGPFKNIIAWLVPGLELVLAFALFPTRSRLIALCGSTALMALFTGYISYMLAFAPHLPCNCGGILADLNWTDHLWLNSAFVLAGLIGIYLQRKIKP